jgi:hypothetical protein
LERQKAKINKPTNLILLLIWLNVCDKNCKLVPERWPRTYPQPHLQQLLVHCCCDVYYWPPIGFISKLALCESKWKLWNKIYKLNVWEKCLQIDIQFLQSWQWCEPNRNVSCNIVVLQSPAHVKGQFNSNTWANNCATFNEMARLEQNQADYQFSDGTLTTNTCWLTN